MATANATLTAAPTKTIQRTVFDLNTFNDVLLKKVVTLPAKPASVEEALAAVGNDKEKLLTVIYEGLVADHVETESAKMDGFQTVGEDGELAGPYTGKFADEAISKNINGAILNLAKAFSHGSWDSMNADQKRNLKNQAVEMIRSNPAMVASIAGTQ